MEKLLEKIFGSLPVPYICAVVIVWGLVGFGNSDFYRNHYKIPQWSYMYNENKDAEIDTEEMTADIGLQSGKIVLTPKIEVKYKGETFFIVNIEGLYNINSASIENHDDVSKFCLEIDKQQNEKLKLLRERFGNLLEEFLDEKDKGKIDDCTVEYSLLAEITFQNKNANRSRTRFYKITNDEIRMIREEEKVKLGTENSLNLDQIDRNLSIYTNMEVIEILKDCAGDLVTKIDK